MYELELADSETKCDRSSLSIMRSTYSSPGLLWQIFTLRFSSYVSFQDVSSAASHGLAQLVSSATSATGSDGAFNFLGSGAPKILFEVFLNLYIGLLFVVLVCSLGNRPQGSKWTYTLAMFLFGLCNIITTWCAGYTVYLTVPHDVEGWKDFPQYVSLGLGF